MGEPCLTMREIEEQYRNEWVLVDRPHTGANGEVAGGRVVWHHPDRDEFDRRLPDFPLADSAIFLAGVPDPDPEAVTVVSVWTPDSTPG